MICQKCGFFIEVKDYTDLIRIEEHHLHPKTLDNPKGLGQLIILCRNCHILKLHPLILKIVQEHSSKLKKSKSLYWEWKFIFPVNRKKCIEEIKEFTLNWIKKEDDNKNS